MGIFLCFRLTTNKEGQNKGRKFYTCSQKVCRFFLWEDAANNTTTSAASTSRGVSSRNNSEDAGTKKRKCGVCGQEGLHSYLNF